MQRLLPVRPMHQSGRSRPEAAGHQITVNDWLWQGADARLGVAWTRIPPSDDGHPGVMYDNIRLEGFGRPGSLNDRSLPRRCHSLAGSYFPRWPTFAIT